MTRSSAQMERIGVAAVDSAFSSMGWAFREQGVADHGIDAQVEVDGLTTAPSGRYLAVQIKCGPTYFKQKSEGGWRFPGKTRHLSYWLANLMPVILVLVDPDSGLGYWVQITHDAVYYTNQGWWIEVPSANVLDARSQDTLRGIALAVAPATADPVEVALPLLPPSAVEMLSALRTIDRDGALRLAKFLSEGREQPRATVEALLDASRVWPHATVLRLATIGAYANEHGHQDLALSAFALAADGASSDRVRLRGIAALMAMSAGDRARADDLLHLAREHAGASLLADVAVCAFDADELGRGDALETLLRDVPDDQLDAEPTCLLFLAERAMTRGDLDPALILYERACRRFPRIVGGRLGQARVLIERMVRGRSAVPYRDQQAAVELATSVRDEMREWAGPSENAHRLIVQERMLAQAFLEVITLATPTAFGGQANDREAVDPTVAIMGAQASVALGDRTRAGRFSDAMRDTPTEPLIRAIAAGPNQPRADTTSLWRTALDNAASALAARICLHQLAVRGALDAADLTRFGTLANLDAQDHVLFTARNTAGTGDLDSAITLLRSQQSPAAGEMLIELLREAGRYEEALAACDETWRTYGALKALQDKINILAFRGDTDGAEACAAQLLATGELADEQRRQLHHRLIERRMRDADWADAEACSRTALRDQPDDDQHAWGLIFAQLNQGRWEAAWASYRQLAPEIHDPGIVRAWVDLHLRFGLPPEARVIAKTLIDRFGHDPDAAAQLARLDVVSH
ncbi:protein of unknown function (DUF4365) [Micromonospora viridifaciens]|uniref:DUF4365 domain-containing protein n=2 Tax=Micromonospora viridifaciens TaxID=1881 RepID=A0A1C4YEF2_MICVI|nr:protein of unknown function (DUF4365) [Micromonospora viridifaciens]